MFSTYIICIFLYLYLVLPIKFYMLPALTLYILLYYYLSQESYLIEFCTS